MRGVASEAQLVKNLCVIGKSLKMDLLRLDSRIRWFFKDSPSLQALYERAKHPSDA